MIRNIAKVIVPVLAAVGLACGPGPEAPEKDATADARPPRKAPAKPARKARYALWFDGRDDMLRTGKWFDGEPKSFCFEAWVKPTLVNPFSGSGGFLVHKAPGRDCFMQYRWDRHALSFGGFQPYPKKPLWVTSGRRLTRDGWHHAATVFDGRSVALYADGAEVGRTSVTHVFDWNVEGYAGSFVGGDPLRGVLNQKHFRGQIDEVRIWDRPRPVEEIRATMNRSIPPDTPGLVAYWSFEEGAGQVTRDISGHNLDAHFGATPGVDPNDPVWVRSDCPIDGLDDAGPAGYLAWFDGKDDWILCGVVTGLKSAKALTLEAWVCPSAPLGRACLLAAGQTPDKRDLGLWQNADGSLEVAVRTAEGQRTCRSQPALQPSAWQHIAVAYDGDNVAVRIDGRTVHSESWDAPTALLGEPLSVGAAADGSEPFSGEMDELRIWSVARGEEQIRAAMKSTVSTSEPGLVGYWRFDEGGGQVVRDWSPSVAHAQWGVSNVYDVSDPLWLVSDAPIETLASERPPRPGQFGGALEFDGRDDFVDLGNSPELRFNMAVTLEAWIRPDSVKKEVPILAKANARGRQNAVELQIKNGHVRFRISDGKAECCGDQGWWPVGSKAKIEPGHWHHVAGVYNGKQVSVYIDGLLQGAAAFSRPISNIPFSMYVGMDSIAQPTYFRGHIDEVRVWDRARTQAELFATMNTTLRGDEPGLIGYLTFDEPFEAGVTTPTCQVAVDHSGNNNHGIFGQWIRRPETRDPRWVISGAPIVPAPPAERGR